MKNKITVMLVCSAMLALSILLMTGCNNKKEPEMKAEVTTVVDENTKTDVIVEAKSENIVEDYDAEGYKFGEADIMCNLPKGFVASEYEGEYIPKNGKDMSSINQIIYDSDENLTLKTKDEYKAEIEQEFINAYGVELEVDITQYDKIMIDGRPGLWIMYNYEFKGGRYDTLVVSLFNGTESNIITFLQAPGTDWMEKFIATAESIHYSDADETESLEVPAAPAN